MRAITEWKEIAYRGGVIRFKIPAHWVEEYERAGGGAFHEPGDDERTLFVDVITVEVPGGATSSDGAIAASMAKLAEKENTLLRELPNGNLFVFHVVDGQDQGKDLRSYRWLIGSALPPRHARIAVFTYCQPRPIVEEPGFKEFLRSIERQLEATEFASELGIRPH